MAQVLEDLHSTSSIHTDVLVIGNGPAGIALSGFLSGLVPFYDPESPHPDPYIHSQLLEQSHIPIIDQDLRWCEGVEQLGDAGRSLSGLLDSLTRPGADTGEQRPGCLQWKTDPVRAVPHLVLGQTDIGGSWNNYDPEMLAVSFSSWFDLPGYSVGDFIRSNACIRRYQGVSSDFNSKSRIPSIVIARYMAAYTRKMGLRKNFLPNTTVISIKKVGDIWHSECRSPDGRPFEVTAGRLVLACGKTSTRTLGVSPYISKTVQSGRLVLACGKTSTRTLGLGEDDWCRNIVYDVRSLKARLQLDAQLGRQYDSKSRVIVVGDGISSADVIRHCLDSGIPVLHVMRRNDRQLRGIMMSRLSPAHFSEYHSVHRLMTGKEHHSLYQRLSGANVVAVNEKTVTIATVKGIVKEDMCVMAVCIGRVSDGESLIEGGVGIDGYFSDTDPSLMAVGSFAGDHFVRYLVGGCMEVARGIHNQIKETNNNLGGPICP